MCKNFAAKELDDDKPAKAEFLNKSVRFFKEKDTFDMEEFSSEVITQPKSLISLINTKIVMLKNVILNYQIVLAYQIRQSKNKQERLRV